MAPLLYFGFKEIGTMEKVKLYNPQKFDVGIKTINSPMGINIKPGSFALVDDIEVSYIASNSTLIQRGILRVESLTPAQDDSVKEIIYSLGIDPDNDPNFVSDEEIQKKLTGAVKKMTEWLDTIEEPILLSHIRDIATEMGDKIPMSKWKILNEKIPSRE